MIAGTGHSMMAQANHDELAEQLFVRDLKGYLSGRCEAQLTELAESSAPPPGHNDLAQAVFERLEELPGFNHWLSARRHSQNLLWDVVGACVARQTEELESRSTETEGIGSVLPDEDFVVPRHLAEADVHLMPGGYDEDDGGLIQGAIMDRGGAVYMLGRNGGMMNDRRGHTAAAHLLQRFPDFAPKDIVEIGCGIGSSLLPMAEYFPDANAHGFDVGIGLLRYARARAASNGVALNLRLGDATNMPYADESFDLVFSCVVLHELEPDSMPAMLSECHRILRPGGVVLHLEVPQRYDELELWPRVRAEIEARYNNEPNWKQATSADYPALLGAAGFREIAFGYQDATDKAKPDNNGFGDESRGVFRSWAVMSALK